MFEELLDRAEEGRFKMPCVGDVIGLAGGAEGVPSAACGAADGACILLDARGDVDDEGMSGSTKRVSRGLLGGTAAARGVDCDASVMVASLGDIGKVEELVILGDSLADCVVADVDGSLRAMFVEEKAFAMQLEVGEGADLKSIGKTSAMMDLREMGVREEWGRMRQLYFASAVQVDARC